MGIYRLLMGIYRLLQLVARVGTLVNDVIAFKFRNVDWYGLVPIPAVCATGVQ